MTSASTESAPDAPGEAGQGLSLPYEFDTSDVWRTILEGTLGLGAILAVCALAALATGRWPAAVGLAVGGAMLLGFARVVVRFQTGSAGVLSADRVDVRPNQLLGFVLPGPVGVYPLARFSAVRVEFRSGPIQPDVQGGPNEVVWLSGREGTPDIALARTQDGAGRVVGHEFGVLLGLPVEETGQPRVIRL